MSSGFKPPDELDQSNAPGAAAKQPVSLYETLRDDDRATGGERGGGREQSVLALG